MSKFPLFRYMIAEWFMCAFINNKHNRNRIIIERI